MLGAPLLLGDDGYQISRSVRLRSSASAYFSRTFGTPTNQNVWTYSGWFKLGQAMVLMSKSTATYYEYIAVDSTGTFFWVIRNAAGTVYKQTYATSQKLRDYSAWYHFVARKTASLTVDFTVNNQAVALTSSSAGTPVDAINSAATAHNIGWSFDGSSNQYSDGYLTEVNFIDGQALTASSFGETDAVTGVWKPKKYAGTYGTNGFYLNFADNSAATAAAIGKDSSGNGNNWTPNNISVTAGATYDSMLDTPTPYADGGNGRGNYAVLNPLYYTGTVTSIDGNMNGTTASGTGSLACGIGMSSGKWYCEIVRNSVSAGTGACDVGVVPTTQATPYCEGTNAVGYYNINGNKYVNTVATAYGAAWGTGDVMGIALDVDGGTVTFYKNGSSQGAITLPAAGLTWLFAASQETGTGVLGWQFNFGQRPFTYTPPTGFLALNTQNLPDSTIKKGSSYFDVKTRSGTGATATITGYQFAPDLVWIKARNNIRDHGLMDTVRGVQKYLGSNTTNAENTTTNGLTAFNADGYTLGSSASDALSVNLAADTFVDWAWNAGGSTVSNTNGTVTSSVRANPTAGISVITATSNGANPFTVGHGLGVTPSMYIFKNRDTIDNWNVWHKSLASTTDSYLLLNSTAAVATNAGQWGAGATSTTIGIRGASLATNGQKILLYAFSEVAGFSKFGSYTGNGSADGPFVFTGFKPRWIMWKRTDAAGASWNIYDTSRSAYNASTADLFANLSNAESTQAVIDILSNGWKIRDAGGAEINASGGTYIFAAFAENPFKNSLAR